LASGIDPSAQAKLEKVARATASANTFSVIADEYVDKMRREGRADATVEKTTWLLEFARPDLGNRPVSEISAVEVLHVLRKVEARGKLESARRLRSTIGSVFRYAIATARAENDPTFALRGALTTPRVTPRAAVTEEKALGALLRAVDAYDGQPVTRIALQLAALLFPRPGELRQAEWREFDLSAAVWAVPAARTKMRREHRVPLSRQAVQRLAELSSMTGAGKLAFPSVRSAMRPISDGTLNAALRRLGYTKDEATSHGFRATASTLLNESGLWNPDAIERQLAHVEGNDVRRAYARGEHWEERVRMMQWWADRLDELRLE
jgi:integrase